ncbi:MAG TPA: S41 family peptidase [Chitinophaga sp.]|uniref:S41 family peptidase n=1 Tax=Chitinophaga sp. TaxID=1869181 RepID=UPI002CB7FA22|nr:S41 family peptidase [Chitinophaga sp.]HVI43563.1 S41 family peptidase [Chitinophaga sp.]
MRKTNWLHAFLLILFPVCVHAQWKAVYYRTAITDTAYDINTDKSLPKSGERAFPEYFYFDNLNSIRQTVDCSKPYPLPANAVLPQTDKDEVPVLYRQLDRQTVFGQNMLVAAQRFYTSNIQRYSVYFYSAQRKQWFRKSFQAEFQGYQLPVTTPVVKWDASPAGEQAPATDQLLVSVVPAKGAPEWKFVIGGFVIGNQVRMEEPVTHPFFKDLAQPALTHKSAAALPLQSDFFHVLPDELNGSSIPSKIYIRPTDDNKYDLQDRALLQKVLTSCLNNYPFYAERRLSKADAQQELNAIFSREAGNTYCSLVDATTEFVRSKFNDMHFYIEKTSKGECPVPAETAVKSPVRLIDINNSYYIAANFDTTAYHIHLNDEVLTINGKPANAVFDSIARARYGNSPVTPVKRSLIVSSMLDRGANDSCILSVRHNGEGYTEQAALHYDRKFSVPGNFRAVQCEYRSYPGNVAYFRINAWEPSVYLQFINHLQEFKQAAALVIDLRGNGGGELLTAMQLFSVFIDQPADYFRYLTGGSKPEPATILPQQAYQLPSALPVVLLGDAVTACASETFIRAMQQRGHTRFMATSSTVGTVASKYDIIFPSGIIVHTNGIERKTCYKTPEDVIETHGIQPDETVKISRVEDLRPYKDKVLTEAIRYLSADKTGIAENRRKE